MSFCLLTVLAYSQSSISGKILDGANNEPLVGATVFVLGTNKASITDIDGNFIIQDVPTGDYSLEVSYLGYGTTYQNVSLANGTNQIEAIGMKESGVGLESVVITGVLDIVQDRSTPVAVSTISSRDIQLKLGNQEFPEIMKSTPSIYVTKQGGGYGDSRINVRGFDQTNTSYLINGQPVNDMENGRVFWSNWSGLQDIASAIQIQRGIGASRLAVPSVGGTVNIVTKSTEREQGGFASASVGNDGYTKGTLSYGTGEMSSGFSASALVSYWQGNGYVDGTQGQGYNYLAAVGYNAGGGHMFNASFLGAGQWHHQRSQWLTIEDYETYGGDDFRRFNADWGLLNGEEYTFRRNFYNKPLAALNWDWKVSEKTSIGAVLYGSWGRGGGTGPRGRNFGIYPFRQSLTQGINGGRLPFRTEAGLIDFDAVVANNQAGNPFTGAGASGVLGANDGDLRDVDGINTNIAIRRSSINSHNWYGGIVNINHQIGDLTLGLGGDVRSYSGLHYRILNDLLGLDAYVSSGNSNDDFNIVTEETSANPFVNIDPEDKINYYNIGNVAWAGVNGLAEYNNGTFTTVVQAGYSNQSYQREDFFRYSGSEQQSETHNQGGGFLKGGISYNLDEYQTVFGNAGYISRQPFFDAIFPNFANDVNPDIENEEITSFELGYGVKSKNARININLYNTVWGNRFLSRGVQLGNGVEGRANYDNLKNVHRGIEIESDFNLTSKVKARAMASFGDWRYNGDVTASVFDDNLEKIGESTLYLSGVKVGDAAQTTVSLGVDYKVIDNLTIDAGFNYYTNLYADFSVLDDEFLNESNRGSVELPAYGLFDAGLTYNHPLDNGSLITFRANVNNVLDTEYIAESRTNIHIEGGKPRFNGLNRQNSVWWGFGRTWNASLKYSF